MDPGDHVERLGERFVLWRTPQGDAGAIVDWPGCPLVVETGGTGLVVRAHVGSGGDADAGDDLDRAVSAELGDLRVRYVEPAEQAWLVGEDRGDLREICVRVAALAPVVAEQLVGSVDLDPPLTRFEERVDAGPW